MSGQQGRNAAQIKQYNRTLILESIGRQGAVSRTELSGTTGLTKGGITPIISDLLKLGLLRETATQSAGPGRNPVMLELSDEACSIIAVQWTRSDGTVALVAPSGTVLSRTTFPFRRGASAKTVINVTRKRISALLAENTASGGSKVIGIGMVAPGPIDRRNGIIQNPPNFHGWRDVHVADKLSDLGLPVLLENNANACGIAEQYFGCGRTYPGFITLVVDEGIGSAIIINGRLHGGRGGYGNELGHLSINMQGPQCTCGNRGCVEMYAAVPRMMEAFRKQRKNGSDTEWPDLVEALDKGNSTARKIIRKEAEYLAAAIVSAVNLLEPDAVILSSDITQAGEHILSPLKKLVEKHTFNRASHLPEILLSTVSDPFLKGGAALVFDRFIQGAFGEFEEVLR